MQFVAHLQGWSLEVEAETATMKLKVQVHEEGVQGYFRY